MAIVDVVVRTTRSLPEIISDTVIVGTVGDVGSHMLRFHRSDEYAGKDMRVLLSRDGSGWKQYDLGATNELVLKDQFKSGDQLHLFAMFWSGDDYRIGTNVLVFIVRSAPESGAPDYLSILVDRAIVDASTSNDGSKNEFKNLAGNVMFTTGIGSAIPGGRGTVIAPDWSQNDSAMPNYIKNRPCYTEPGVVLFDTTTLAFEETEPGSGTGIWAGESKLAFEEWQEYVVTWDGVEYVVVGKWCQAISDSSPLLGNPFLLNDKFQDTGEPFVFIPGSRDNPEMEIIAEGVEPIHTISIVSDVHHKLNAGHIPVGNGIGIWKGKIVQSVAEVEICDEEIDTGRRVRGRPIYEKTIMLPQIDRGQSRFRVSHRIYQPAALISINGGVDASSSGGENGMWLPIPQNDGSAGVHIRFTKMHLEISVGSGYYNLFGGYVTIQYIPYGY